MAGTKTLVASLQSFSKFSGTFRKTNWQKLRCNQAFTLQEQVGTIEASNTFDPLNSYLESCRDQRKECYYPISLSFRKNTYIHFPFPLPIAHRNYHLTPHRLPRRTHLPRPRTRTRRPRKLLSGTPSRRTPRTSAPSPRCQIPQRSPTQRTQMSKLAHLRTLRALHLRNHLSADLAASHASLRCG